VIEYCRGYKYQLRSEYRIQTPIRPGIAVHTDLVELGADGLLVIKKYFAWDGCTFPAINTRTNLRAGLVHDALYYLMRSGLDIRWRNTADEMLRQIMIEDGAWSVRADYFYRGVQWFAERYATIQKKIYTAP